MKLRCLKAYFLWQLYCELPPQKLLSWYFELCWYADGIVACVLVSNREWIRSLLCDVDVNGTFARNDKLLSGNANYVELNSRGENVQTFDWAGDTFTRIASGIEKIIIERSTTRLRDCIKDRGKSVLHHTIA